MSEFIAVPSAAYQNEKGLKLVQKHIVELGGSFVMEGESGNQTLRITAPDGERTGEHFATGKAIPHLSVADEIKWYLTEQYLWSVKEA
jgi:hypothetical protein